MKTDLGSILFSCRYCWYDGDMKQQPENKEVHRLVVSAHLLILSLEQGECFGEGVNVKVKSSKHRLS